MGFLEGQLHMKYLIAMIPNAANMIIVCLCLLRDSLSSSCRR